MAATERKLAITCGGFPPLVIGSPVLMANLFRAYHGGMEAVVGWEYGAKLDPAFTPPCKTHYLRFKPDIVQRAVQHFPALYFFLIKWFVWLHLKRLRPAAVFAACTPDGRFLTASLMACRRLKIPLWAHMHDLWLDNAAPGSFEERLAKQWEAVLFREADKVFCMTEAQQEHYQAKYGRACELLPHCVPADMEIPASVAVRTKSPGQHKWVLYTGNISSGMNLDALAQFVKCVDLLPPDYKIRMLISCSARQCRRMGLYHERIEYGWVSVAESQRLIREADVLFLPLSFKNCSAAEVKTVFATKALDYLVSGVPILVFSPPQSYHSRSAKERGWGCVVEAEDVQLLAKQLQELATDAALRNTVVRGALAEARRRDPRPWADRLRQYLEDNR
jgi:glycosyltransferase involved in cell wall biosynthesis